MALCYTFWQRLPPIKKINRTFQLEGELLLRHRLLPNPTFFFNCIENPLVRVWMAKSYFAAHRYYLKVSLTIKINLNLRMSALIRLCSTLEIEGLFVFLTILI